MKNKIWLLRKKEILTRYLFSALSSTLFLLFSSFASAVPSLPQAKKPLVECNNGSVEAFALHVQTYKHQFALKTTWLGRHLHPSQASHSFLRKCIFFRKIKFFFCKIVGSAPQMSDNQTSSTAKEADSQHNIFLIFCFQF